MSAVIHSQINWLQQNKILTRNSNNLETKMVEKKKKAHAIMISMPHQGHINPFVALALNLASKGITITFVHLQHVHHRLSNNQTQLDLFSDARESGLDIRYATISDGFPLDYDRDLKPEEYWNAILQTFRVHVDEFVGKMIQSDPHSSHFLVTDIGYVWPAAVARKYNLINVGFSTTPALEFSLLYHLELLKGKGHLFIIDDEAEIDYVPGVRSIRNKDLMSYLIKPFKLADNLSSNFEEVKKADFILHNTVEELESDTLSALCKYQPNYAIGPIDFSPTSKFAVTKSLRAGIDVTKWLESKPAGSVLYVSFGSVVQTSKQVIEEIAHGLLLSEVSFIWVVRARLTDSEEGDVLPVGFEEKIKDKGLIVPWCDQISVLSNEAVGGFLTHCGWNSIVESMWFGVPMICFPIAYDQPTNRKLVVDDWQIGINLRDGEGVDGKGVAEKIRGFMSGGGSERLRREARKAKQTVRIALETDGSSRVNLDNFIVDLEKKLNY